MEQLEVLAQLVDAHEQRMPNRTDRVPIFYVKYLGGGHLQHHGLSGEVATEVDEVLLEELHSARLIDIDYNDSTLSIAPTAFGKRIASAYKLMEVDPSFPIDGIRAALTSQASSANRFRWDSVRPVLVEIRKAWESDGYPTDGISIGQLQSVLDDDEQALLSATVRQLFDADYLTSSIPELKLGGAPSQVQITEKSLQALDGWPGASSAELAENLLSVLSERASTSDDPEERSKLEQISSAGRDLGVDLLGALLAKAVLGE